MLLHNRYNIKEQFIWLVSGVCALPIVLNLLGINFGFVNHQFDLGMISRIYAFENETDFKQILRGRYVHIIFVSFSIAISCLTIILAFIDFRIKGELSTPIVGVALFCSGLFYLFHVLAAANLIPLPKYQFYLTSFTWFFCRLFHASILLLGTSVLLFQSKSFQEETSRHKRKFVIYMSALFVLLTGATIAILFNVKEIPRNVTFPYHNIARPYDLIPLALYLFAGFYILPKFYEKYPSVFSQTLLLSMIPAVATQIYMAFGSDELFDNSFNISHVITAFTYFIPFIGLSLNYLQTYKNERNVIGRLNQEVKERKTVEEVLSGVLNSSVSSIMAFRSVRHNSKIVDFEWTLLNPATQALFGANYFRLHGKKLLREIPAVKNESWIEMFSSVVETNESLNYEYFSDYFQKWLLLSGIKLEDGIAVTINDISKRKNALQKLMNAEKLTVTGRLARTIAHEVRNPLTNINLSIEHLKGNPPEDHEMYFDIIKRNSERINQLITELLNSSKPAELKLNRYPVNKLLDETLELALDRMRLKEISLEKNYCPEKIEVNMDVEKVKTAFLNLIINAVEAMEPGKGILKISCAPVDQRCLITIEDNGSGIDKDHLEHLFEPFFSKKSKGMGLGLTATQNIILTHKGTIDVKSVPGAGTKFSIGFSIST
jgi:signal transduction histidine kinase